MASHIVSFCRDFDEDGFVINCPKWNWEVNVIADADPIFCPMCGEKLPSPSHIHPGATAFTKEAGRDD